MKKNIRNYETKRGMTIVETVVAIAIMSLLFLSIASVISTFASSERRNRAIAETEWQASNVLYEIAQSARSASSITAPSAAATSTSLTLALSGVPTENPTVYSLSSGVMRVSKAGGSTNPISGSNVRVTNIIFQNVTASGTKGSIRVTLSLSYVNSSGKMEMNYSTTRYVTITLR